MPDKEPVAALNFYDLLILIAEWRKLFIVNFLLVVSLSAIISLILPVWYSAKTVILPPSGSGGGGLPSFLSKDLVGVASSFGLELPTEDIYQTILESRTLKERIITRFDLRKVYKVPKKAYPEDLLKVFDERYTVKTREDQSIEVYIEDRDPVRAAEMANACIEELDRLYREITSLSARNNRTYIGKRLAEINDTLATLQDSLIKFQREYRAFSLPDQIAGMIQAAANVKAEQMAIDLQLSSLNSALGERHPQVVQLKQQSRELRDQYHSILQGEEGDLFLSLSKLPDIGRAYADIYREIRIQTSLLEFVYPQFESAKIQEERETANVQILDRATPPYKKYRPPRRLIVMLAGAASIIFTLVFVLLARYWSGLPSKNHEDWSKIQQIRKKLTGKVG
jgi:uncharacterized protein involved in exopolysaccharide biosynthesis